LKPVDQLGWNYKIGILSKALINDGVLLKRPLHHNHVTIMSFTPSNCVWLNKSIKIFWNITKKRLSNVIHIITKITEVKHATLLNLDRVISAKNYFSRSVLGFSLFFRKCFFNNTQPFHFSSLVGNKTNFIPSFFHTSLVERKKLSVF
jgi:hypothetical protein